MADFFSPQFCIISRARMRLIKLLSQIINFSKAFDARDVTLRQHSFLFSAREWRKSCAILKAWQGHVNYLISNVRTSYGRNGKRNIVCGNLLDGVLILTSRDASDFDRERFVNCVSVSYILYNCDG